MSNIVLNTLKSIFKERDSTKYLILDETATNILNTYFEFEKLIQDGIVGVFKIDSMLSSTHLTKEISAKSLTELKENLIYYIIEPTDQNLLLMEKQLVLFNKNVTVICTEVVTDNYIDRLANLDTTDNIVSIKSIPIDTKCFTDIAIITNDFPDIFKRGYYIISEKSMRESSFNKQLVQKFENATSKCNGKYSTIVISIARSFDQITPFIIPWTYLSVIAYYLSIINNTVMGPDSEILLKLMTDPFFPNLKYKPYTDIIDFVTRTMKELIKNNSEYQESIKNGKIDRETTTKYLETKRSIDSLTKHMKIIEIINKLIEKSKAPELSELQVSMLNGISYKEFLSTFTKIKPILVKAYTDTLMMALYIYQSDRQNIMNFIETDPFFQKTNKFYTDICKKVTVNNTKMTTISDIKTGKFKQLTEMSNPIMSPIMSPNLNIGNSNFTIVNRKQENIFLQHVPTIQYVLMCLLKPDSGKLDRNFMKADDLKTNFNINTGIGANSGIDSIIVHIDEFVTYDEIITIGSLIESLYPANPLTNNHTGPTVIVHSESIKI